ncbi:MAG TPA: restriction endonuclease [Luteimonas sp.]|nr:restriction endonuclease [Luteimonas sp.]
MTWQQFQSDTADLFRQLGCTATIEAAVKGVRASHKVDVYVEFVKFGIPVKWVIECKLWNRNIPKERVMTLKAIVDDLGADRGVLISSKGFQAGAISAAQNSNITLTDLPGLRATAASDLDTAAIYSIEQRILVARHTLNSMYTREPTEHGFRLKIARNLNGLDPMREMGKLSVLQYGTERVRLGKPPFPVGFDTSGDKTISAATIEEFVKKAHELLVESEASLRHAAGA